MVTKLLSASAILAVAGVASGATFGVNTVDAGGVTGGSLGNPITWTGGAAFNPGTGSNFPASPQGIAGAAALGVDSYVAIDPVGPSTAASSTTATDGYQCLGPSNIISPTSPTTIFQTDRLTGIWFNAGAGGGFVTSGAGDRIMIAQITLRAASAGTITTAGVLVNIKDAGTANADGELGSLRFGQANASNNSGKWGQSYYLVAEGRAATGATGAFVGGTTYTIWVTAVPAPGAAGVMGLAGLVALRRRR